MELSKAHAYSHIKQANNWCSLLRKAAGDVGVASISFMSGVMCLPLPDVAPWHICFCRLCGWIFAQEPQLFLRFLFRLLLLFTEKKKGYCFNLPVFSG